MPLCVEQRASRVTLVHWRLNKYLGFGSVEARDHAPMRYHSGNTEWITRKNYVVADSWDLALSGELHVRYARGWLAIQSKNSKVILKWRSVCLNWCRRYGCTNLLA